MDDFTLFLVYILVINFISYLAISLFVLIALLFYEIILFVSDACKPTYLQKYICVTLLAHTYI